MFSTILERSASGIALFFTQKQQRCNNTGVIMIHRESYSALYTKEDLKDHSGVAVVIKNKNNEVLMQKHVKIGKWTIPAGKVVPESSLKETISKEMFEETGLIITKTVFLKDRMFVYKKNNVIVNTHSHVFEALEYIGTLENKEPHKHNKQLFMRIEDILKLPNLSDVTMLWLGIPDG